MPKHDRPIPARNRKILAIDVGGTHVKVMLSPKSERRKFDSGARLTAKEMVAKVKDLTRRLGLRRHFYRLSGSDCARPSARGAVQSWHRLGRLRFCQVLQVPGQDRQRCRHAGARQLFRRAHVVPRPRHRIGVGHDRRWRGRTDGTRPFALQKGQDLEYFLGTRGMKRKGKKKWRAYGAAAIEISRLP